MRKQLNLFICLLFGSFTLLNLTVLKAEASEIHVAYAGPVSEKKASSGRTLVQSIRLYFDQINEAGGIDGKKIVLDLYNDENTPEVAKQRAREIVENDAVAVIGHWYSSCSLAAKEIYNEAGIPVLTFSVHDNVTKDNNVFFRTVYYNDLQGGFLANYAIKILGTEKIAVIHGGQDYETGLKDTFIRKVEDLGGKIVFSSQYETGNPTKNPNWQKLITTLKQNSDVDLIFLSSQATDAIPLVKLIRNLELKVEIMGPGALTDSAFISGFDNMPVDRIQQLAYSNGIYVSSPLLFDIANAQAQVFKSSYESTYNETASAWGAYAYDNAMLLVKAFQATGISGESADVSQNREQVLAFLAGLNSPETSIPGVTGLNYFDETGNSHKPLAIGKFKNGLIISAMTQLQGMKSKVEVFDFDRALEEGTVLGIGNEHMYRTNIVYTGVKIHEISDWDKKTYSVFLKFDLWFRMSADNEINTQDIIFNSTYEPVRLEKPIQEFMQNNIIYRRYQVEGKFKIDPAGWSHGFEDHVVAISFQHRTHSRKRLIFVTDLVGMGLKPNSDVGNKVLAEGAISKAISYMPKEINLFQNIATIEAMGDPEFLNAEDALVQFSRFNVGVWFEPEGIHLRRSTPAIASWIMAIVGILAFIFFQWQSSSRKPFLNFTTVFVFKTISILALLFAVESLLIEYLLIFGNEIKLVFDMLWWMIPAMIINRSVTYFVFQNIERRTGRSIPGVIPKSIGFIIYLLAIFGIIAFVYDEKVTSLLATSGLAAMIIGLAIQINIANIFSGIVINMEHPFHIGDWVQFGDFEEGKIIDINWRSTRLITRKGNILSIPNSQAAETVMRNYSHPYDIIWGWHTVHVPIENDPEQVLDILNKAAQAAQFVRKEPAPAAIYMGLSEWSNTFMVMYCYEDYQSKLAANESIWKNVWKYMDKAGIHPAERRPTIKMLEDMEEMAPIAVQPADVLNRIDLLKMFRKSDLNILIQELRPKLHKKESPIVREGNPGGTMFVIVEGTAVVTKKVATGEEIEIKELGPGAAFGETNLFTGENFTENLVTTSDTVVLAIDRRRMKILLRGTPSSIPAIADKIAEMQKKVGVSPETGPEQQSTTALSAQELEKSIRDFYDIA